MLIPETVDLPARQAALVLEERAALVELGLEVEDFGGGTLILNSYPVLLGRRSPKAVLRAVVDYVLTQGTRAQPRAVAQRLAQPDGLPCRCAGRRPA